MDEIPVLSLVIPCYNEEESFTAFFEKIDSVLGDNTDITLELVFVNDGSTDNTLACLLERQKQDSRITIVDLSRNFGKEAALSAGLQYATGQIAVPMDVDLQDPPELILDMISKWREGYEVVLAKRSSRDTDSLAKRLSAKWFYRVHNMVAEQKIPENVGDFRLMDRKVIDAINSLPEHCRFMKGLFAWVGFRTTTLEYERPKRAAGTSKFSPLRLWNLALEGITGFSTAPLRIWTYLGLFFALVAFVYALIICTKTLIFGIDVPGYASLMVAITFFGGVQLMGIGIIGEYLGRNYMESKKRPVYIVRKLYS